MTAQAGRVIGFVPRAELARALDERSDGRLQLNPPEVMLRSRAAEARRRTSRSDDTSRLRFGVYLSALGISTITSDRPKRPSTPGGHGPFRGINPCERWRSTCC